MSGADLAGILGAVCALAAAILGVLAWRQGRFTAGVAAITQPTPAAADRPRPAGINYDTSKLYTSDRSRIADEFSEGRTIILARVAANRVENLLSDLANNDEALEALGLSYDGLTLAGLRQAISNAIEAADNARN